MPALPWSRVVSFSSEDPPAYRASNLLSADGGRKWRSATDGHDRVWAVLALPSPAAIASVHLGNMGSALVEVQVARGCDAAAADFATLLPASSFMSPLESRNWENTTRVRIFGADQLNREVAREKWDTVKVVCTQPFNRRVKYGLSFVAVSSQGEEKERKDGGVASAAAVSSPSVKKLGAFTLRAENEGDPVGGNLSVGSLFTKKAENTGGASVAAELRSDATLASLALGRDSPRRVVPKKATTTAESKKNRKQEEDKKRRRDSNGTSSKAKLPRRDVLPGESPPSPRQQPVESASSSKRRLKAETPSSSSKRSNDDARRPAKKRVERPFSRLMQDVVFAISGYQNPLRGDIRQAALAMGARYRPDWDATCTHLVCAFANTPKFNQVRRAGGKIVKRQWVEESSRDRRRYPWRRFCLDPNDKGSESEEEVFEQMEEEPQRKQDSRRPPSEDEDDADTDDELEKIQARNGNGKAKASDRSSNAEDSDEAYDADTDVDEDTGGGRVDLKSLPPLPEFFSGKNFLLGSRFSSSRRKLLTRLIVAAGGQLSDYMGPGVDVVVAERDAVRKGDVEDARRANPRVAVVRPEFVTESWEAKVALDEKSYALTR